MGIEESRTSSRKESATTLRSLLLDTLPDYHRGVRGRELQRAFFARAERGQRDGILGEVQAMVRCALSQLCIESQPGIRLGSALAGHSRLDDEACVENLAAHFLLPKDDRKAGVGSASCWLDGELFSTGRVEAHLRACEESVDQAIGQITRNVRHGIQRLREDGDPIGTALFQDLREAVQTEVDRGDLRWLGDERRRFEPAQTTGAELARGEATRIFVEAGGLAEMARVAFRYYDPDRPEGRIALRGKTNRKTLDVGLTALVRAGCGRIDLSRLSNDLREELPAPSGRTTPETELVGEVDGSSFLDSLGGPETDHPGGLDLDTVRQDMERKIADLPRLSASRRERLKRLARCLLDAAEDRLGAEKIDHVEIQRTLGVSKQTYSDDRKIIESPLREVLQVPVWGRGRP